MTPIQSGYFGAEQSKLITAWTIFLLLIRYRLTERISSLSIVLLDLAFSTYNDRCIISSTSQYPCVVPSSCLPSWFADQYAAFHVTGFPRPQVIFILGIPTIASASCHCFTAQRPTILPTPVPMQEKGVSMATEVENKAASISISTIHIKFHQR
ncbi:predicted protein [Lichtheimia corymbifera JMRC:FSU:9682]|uniref:Uncharacterized protein n=1 Tax=Lichtheimia corymbifera JMRC:FSU:9682 TaxID=1263082 RepID=A0A068RYW7_9FUNG|nr:predicted protein [Lichtheimia corymbifera JMRC:FSU:9682]